MHEQIDVIELLKELIAIDSKNPFLTTGDGAVGIGNEEKIANYLEKVLNKAGFRVEQQLVQEAGITKDGINIPKRYNLLAEKGAGNISLLFLGHMDTVDEKKGWETNPLVPVEKEDKIYGLGANDMKAGLATIIAATNDVNPDNYKIKVAFVIDEEYWSFGAVKLLKSKFIDDVKAAIVPEVGDFQQKTSNKSIILGRMGRVEYEFTITGVACHGAQARENQSAVNAVHESIKLQQEVIKYCDKCEREFIEGDISIKNSAYISYHQGGDPILSVPDSASFILDRSFIKGEIMEDEIKQLKKLTENARKNGVLDPRTKVEITERKRPTPACKPYFIQPDHPFVKFITEEVEKEFGGYEYGIGWSVADENRIAEHNIPTTVLGPIGENAHAPNEWVDVESVKKLQNVYMQIVKKFLEYNSGI